MEEKKVFLYDIKREDDNWFILIKTLIPKK